MTPHERSTVAYHNEFRGGVWHTMASAVAMSLFVLALVFLVGGAG